MDDYIELDESHCPNFNALGREFEWDSPDLTEFRIHVAYRALLSIFQATHTPVSDDTLDQNQGNLIVELLTHGVSSSETARAMVRAGTNETVAFGIVENIHHYFVDQDLQPDLRVASAHQNPVLPERESGADVKSVLYYIAEEQSRQKAYVHHGIRCDVCGEMPIRGTRWHCSNCTDFDLCSTCEAQNPVPHIKTHVFHKITIPALHLSKSWKVEPVWYPGNPFLMQRTLPKDLVKQLSNDCSYEPFEVEAIYDQFTCVANVEWKQDPLNINAAIDRSAFGKSIMPHTRLRPPSPNLIYERCFAFYDTDNNGLIGFDEFLHGLAYIHKRAFRDQRLWKIFDGYDMDSDGCVSRKDFLRMFRALYTVQQQLTNDMIAIQEEQAADEPRLDLINSSRPLSSSFRERFLPGSLTRRPGKTHDRFGDLLPNSGYGAVVGGSESPVMTNDVAGTIEAQTNGNHQSMQERWRNRSFNLDEEEKVITGPNEVPYEADFNAEDGEGHEDANDIVGLSHVDGVLRRSRSSSRVRFKDELEDDARSQTSTSSRPVGERWGGYEIPEVEGDVGKEVIYDVIQESFNLLLDPLFKTSEEFAMEMIKTEGERLKWKDEMNLVELESRAVKEYKARQLDPLLETARAQGEQSVDADADAKDTVPNDNSHAVRRECREELGLQDCLASDDYDKATQVFAKIEEHIEWASAQLNQPLGTWDAKACSQSYKRHVEKEQHKLDDLTEKITAAYSSAPTAHPIYRHIKELEQLIASFQNLLDSSEDGTNGQARDVSKTDKEASPENQSNLGSRAAHDHFDGEPRDPTLPQFRPTSSAEISPRQEQDGRSLPEPNAPSQTSRSIANGPQLPDPPPSRAYLRHLAMLDQIEREQRERGGSRGKLTFDEFERIMKGPAGTKLEFLDDWLTLVSF
ncbi:MAG: hypothetical protein M1821_009773 [Bathelium mastoideum]|nr:MAG: hypothetical protein M1821_009773 [Bathelium mastoideum]